MENNKIFSDQRGKILVYHLRNKKPKVFSFNENIFQYNFSQSFELKKGYSLIKIDASLSCFICQTFSKKAKKSNALMGITIKKEKFGILETKKGKNFFSKLDSPIQSCCRVENSFAFSSSKKIYLVDKFSGEIFKEIILSKRVLKNFQNNLKLSASGKFLVLQNTFFFLIDPIKGEILKKIYNPILRICFLRLWKGNRFFYSTSDGHIEFTHLNKKKINKTVNFYPSIYGAFSIKMKPLNGNRSSIAIFLAKNVFYFLILEFKKRFQVRKPFFLRLSQKKIPFCFLRSEKNLLIILLMGERHVPIRINLKDSITQQPKQKRVRAKTNKDTPLIQKNNFNKASVFFPKLVSSFEKKNQPDFQPKNLNEIFFKFGNLRKSIIRKVLMHPFWAIKGLIRFKSFYEHSEDLQFFQKKNILKTFSILKFEWVEPILNFILKKILKKNYIGVKFLTLAKELFFHFFLSLIENKIICNGIKKTAINGSRVIGEEKFFDLYVTLTVLGIQKKKPKIF